MILLISRMDGYNLLPCVSLGPDKVKDYKQCKCCISKIRNSTQGYLKLLNPDDMNDTKM